MLVAIFECTAKREQLQGKEEGNEFRNARVVFSRGFSRRGRRVAAGSFDEPHG